MARVVDTDNFGGDYPDERWASGVLSKEDAQTVAADLNRRAGGPNALRFYMVVDDDYQLQPGFTP